jgi:hypothetical protein
MPIHLNGFWIFPLQGVSGDRIAFQFAKGFAIRSEGDDKFIIYASNQAIPVTTTGGVTLDALVAAL